jgi:hypothetical protein
MRQSTPKGTKVKGNIMGNILSFPEKEMHQCEQEMRKCKTESQWREYCEVNSIDPIIMKAVIDFGKKHNFGIFDAYQCLAGLSFIKYSSLNFIKGSAKRNGVALDDIIKSTL